MHYGQRGACRQQDRDYNALWITSDDLQAEGLLLSRHMLLDHFPDRVLNILRKTLWQLEDGGGTGGQADVGMAAVGGAAGSPAVLQPPRLQSAVYCRGADATASRACRCDSDAASRGRASRMISVLLLPSCAEDAKLQGSWRVHVPPVTGRCCGIAGRCRLFDGAPRWVTLRSERHPPLLHRCRYE